MIESREGRIHIAYELRMLIEEDRIPLSESLLSVVSDGDLTELS